MVCPGVAYMLVPYQAKLHPLIEPALSACVCTRTVAGRSYRPQVRTYVFPRLRIIVALNRREHHVVEPSCRERPLRLHENPTVAEPADVGYVS